MSGLKNFFRRLCRVRQVWRFIRQPVECFPFLISDSYSHRAFCFGTTGSSLFTLMHEHRTLMLEIRIYLNWYKGRLQNGHYDVIARILILRTTRSSPLPLIHEHRILKPGDRKLTDSIQTAACRMASIKPCTRSSRMTDPTHSYWFTSAKPRFFSEPLPSCTQRVLCLIPIWTSSLPSIETWICCALIRFGQFFQGVELFHSCVASNLIWAPRGFYASAGSSVTCKMHWMAAWKAYFSKWNIAHYFRFHDSVDERHYFRMTQRLASNVECTDCLRLHSLLQLTGRSLLR